ncbi:MAG: desulfoferrodoxin family protein [Clostridia bacterium]|nr:desulfoferrodoxin family protein [Clostridia bacterium]
MNEHRFFVCKKCGNLAGLIHASGVPMFCCGEPMAELIPNSTDASKEKHIPLVTQVGPALVKVSVGALQHPMEEAHHIAWVYLQTKEGGQRKRLLNGAPAEVNFTLIGDEPIAVYAYCNLHGLWMKKLK